MVKFGGGGNSPHINNIFKIKKRIIRIITKSSTETCGQLFKKSEILPLHSQYMFSLLLFVVKNWNLYTIKPRNSWC